jgi:uncharacterized integral membrane protein (TIGR00698 family)
MNVSKLIYIGAIAACAFPFVDTPIALLAGVVMAQFFAHPFPKTNKLLTKYLLQVSVVGLGFGMNAVQAMQAGKEGFWFTIISISCTLTLGLLLGKWFKVDKNTSFLISTGTAICGGSAIAAVSPIIKANEKQLSTALGTIFVLNSVALLVFPQIGRWLQMSQHQFGVWAAIAIHDTSSVVGAAHKYGAEALQIATTIKLERALWIIPVSIVTALVFRSDSKKVKIPYFIFLFVVAMLLNSFIPAVSVVSPYIVFISKIGLKITLFLIGSSLSRELLKSVGIKPMLQGVLLWFAISSISLIAILNGVS